MEGNNMKINSPCLQGACFLIGKDLSMEFDLEQETGRLSIYTLDALEQVKIIHIKKDFGIFLRDRGGARTQKIEYSLLFL